MCAIQSLLITARNHDVNLMLYLTDIIAGMPYIEKASPEEPYNVSSTMVGTMVNVFFEDGCRVESERCASLETWHVLNRIVV